MLNTLPEVERSWLRWWTGLGLVVNRAGAVRPDWHWSAPFVHAWADADWLLSCADRLQTHARACAEDRRRWAAEEDPHLDAVQAQVRAFFCDTPQGKKLDYWLDDARRHVLEPRLHYRFQLSHTSPRPEKDGKPRPRHSAARTGGAANAPVRVQEIVHVFRDLTEAGEQLWMQQYDVLRRLTTLRSPALPEVFFGGRIEDATGDEQRALGYLQVRNPGEPLYANYRWILSELRRPREEGGRAAPAHAVAQATALCEALALLHAQSIAHRRIDLNSVLVRQEGDPPIQLTLSGFEFSLVLSAIMQSGGPGSRNLAAERRTDINLLFAAPETLLALIAYPDEPERLMNCWIETDIHAMGVLLAFMFAGPPDDRETDELLALLRPGERHADALQSACDGFHQKRFALLTDRDRWRQAGEGHPECYRRLLDEMRELVARCLSEDPARGTSISTGVLHSGVSRLRVDYERSLLDDGRRFAVVFDQKHMGDNLVRMKLLDGDINSEEGRARVRTEIEGWLKTAEWIHYRPEGFSGSGGHADDSTREMAKYLIVCDQVIFFAAYYQLQATKVTDERLLRLSFTVYRNEIRLPVVEDDESIRMSGAIDVFASGEVGDIAREKYASWKPVLDRVERRLEHPAAFLATATWDFHRELELAAETIKQFPVTVKRSDGTGIAELRLDRERFSDRIKGRRGFIYSLLMRGKDRGNFFIDTIAEWQEDMAAGGSKLMFVRDGDVSPRRFDLEPISVEAEHIKVAESELLTTSGELFFTDFYGTGSASRRQRDAIEALIRNAALFDHLCEPRGDAPALVPISPHCGKDYGDETRKVIQNMKSGVPITALQGPPGTGKTTIVAELVAELLHDDENLRLLITSQSHAATDTTMEKILSTIARKRKVWENSDPDGGVEDIEPDAIRILPQTHTDRVSEGVRKDYTSAAIARKKLEKMREKADEYLGRNSEGTPGLREAYTALKGASEKSAYELRKRIERSAPLVFGTTAASHQARDFLRRPNRYFDVVIVDEAAKAWGIDLVQPLSVGYRAIMVGDHKQLPPFGNEGVADLFWQARESYLNASSGDREARVPEGVSYICHSTQFAGAQAWLKPFERLFDLTKSAGGEEFAKRDAVPVTQTLGTQHRSYAAIGELVSKTFYDHSVKTAERLWTAPRDLPLSLPTADGASIRPVVAWIDTSTLPEGTYGTRSEAAGKLSNDGEIRIVEKRLSAYCYEHDSETPPHERCRIMAPYARQVMRMRQRFEQDHARFGVSGPKELDRIVQTVDAAQGAEADLVVVSMTRSRRAPVPPNSDKAESHDRALWRNYGFLRSSERLNVMFSRARKQLIIVGNFEYFAAFDGMAQAWIATIADAQQRREMGKRLGFWGKLIDHFDKGAAASDGQVVKMAADEILGDRP